MKTIENDLDLSDSLKEYLAQIPPVSDADREALSAAGKRLENDPEFQADVLKSMYVEQILEALEVSGETQSQLALRWGKSRQYVSKLFNESRRVNFTIETMTTLAHLVGRRLEIRVVQPEKVPARVGSTSGFRTTHRMPFAPLSVRFTGYQIVASTDEIAVLGMSQTENRLSQPDECRLAA